MWWAWHFGLFCKNLNATFSKGKSPNRLTEDPQNMIYLDDPASRFFICGISVMELIIYIIFTLICASPCWRVRREDVLVKLVCLKTQYFTLPHTICWIPSDLSGVQMSQIVTWWVWWTLPDSTGVNVDCCPERGVQWTPPDYAVLDSSRVKSPERGIQWTPPESTGMGINSQV